MPSLSFIHSMIRSTWFLSKSHILGKWLIFIFDCFVISLNPEDNESSAIVQSACLCPLPFPMASQSVGQCKQTLSGSYKIPPIFIKRGDCVEWGELNQCPCKPPWSSWMLYVLYYSQKAEVEHMAQNGSITMVCPRGKSAEEVQVVRRHPKKGGSCWRCCRRRSAGFLWEAYSRTQRQICRNPGLIVFAADRTT